MGLLRAGVGVELAPLAPRAGGGRVAGAELPAHHSIVAEVNVGRRVEEDLGALHGRYLGQARRPCVGVRSQGWRIGQRFRRRAISEGEAEARSLTHDRLGARLLWGPLHRLHKLESSGEGAREILPSGEILAVRCIVVGALCMNKGPGCCALLPGPHDSKASV